MGQKVQVGLIGTGNISKAYIAGSRAFDIIDLVACADIDMEKARAAAAQAQIPRACSVADLLADPDIQIVINLTIPRVHAEVSLAAIAAGKHVYSEKPLAVTLEDGKRILAAAREQGVLVACAPDTFLGGGIQTSRKLIDEGWIGEPLAATSSFAFRWVDGGEPERDFMFQRGAGPMLDMGPYYLTALVTLLGPIKRVAASTRRSFPERIVQRGPYAGRKIPVEVPTHQAGVLDFTAGPVATVVTSFDILWGHHMPFLEIYGSEGMISVPDPNFHGGPVRVRQQNKEWEEVPLTHSDRVSRGIGVADLAYAVARGRPQRASGELAYHVLETMLAFEQSSRHNTHIEIHSQPERPAPLPVGLADGQLDD